MPSAYVKSLSKETGKSTNELEKLWDKAKKITSETFNKTEDEFGSKEYSYTVGIVKNMLGLKEELLDPMNFLMSEMSAEQYIETVTSGSFSDIGPDVNGANSQQAVEPSEKDYEITKDEAQEVEPNEEPEPNENKDLFFDGLDEEAFEDQVDDDYLKNLEVIIQHS